MIYTVTVNPAIDRTIRVPGVVPGAVNRVEASRSDAGGKGINVSKMLRVLGGETTALGIIGGATGDMIADHLKQAGIPARFARSEVPTRINVKLIDTETGIQTDLNEPGPFPGRAAVDCLRNLLADSVHPGDGVVLAGSLCQGLPDDFYRDLIHLCKAAGGWVALDCDGDALQAGMTACPDLIKPNGAELSRLMGFPVETPRQAAQAARELAAQGIETVVVSLGAEGAVFCGRETECFYAPGLNISAGSAVGAGDAMVAALALCCLRGDPVAETIRWAMAAGAAAASVSGTQVPDREDIRRLYEQVTFAPME